MSNGNSRYLKIGPGGRRCNCCFPAPGSRDRRAQFRSAKRKAERDAMRQAQNDLIDHQELLHELEMQEFEFHDPYYDDLFDDWKDQLREIEFPEDDDSFYDREDYYHDRHWAA